MLVGAGGSSERWDWLWDRDFDASAGAVLMARRKAVSQRTAHETAHVEGRGRSERASMPQTSVFGPVGVARSHRVWQRV
jgi:hypothetical protein